MISSTKCLRWVMGFLAVAVLILPAVDVTANDAGVAADEFDAGVVADAAAPISPRTVTTRDPGQDARALELPLVSLGPEAEHDWWYLLSRMGWLRADHAGFRD